MIINFLRLYYPSQYYQYRYDTYSYVMLSNDYKFILTMNLVNLSNDLLLFCYSSLFNFILWTKIGDRMLSTFWSPMSSTDVHILSICPPDANECTRIRQTIQTMRGNIRQRGNQSDIAGDNIIDYSCSSINGTDTIWQFTICKSCSNNRKC